MSQLRPTDYMKRHRLPDQLDLAIRKVEALRAMPPERRRPPSYWEARMRYAEAKLQRHLAELEQLGLPKRRKAEPRQP